ncbi:MAG: SusD/RagB family nutrient-binding outer membrane lipoprotein, partial [Bacteroidota bacterium]
SLQGITQILAEGNFIDATTDDFQFPFGSGFAPQNAHPRWIDDYIESDRSGYFANHFMVKMLGRVDATGDAPEGNHYQLLSDNVQYGVEDPRIRFYFRRQLTYERPGDSNIPCVFNNVDCNYYYPGLGYLGRDRGDNSVGPADIPISTKWGAYPAGGVIDNLVADGTNRNESPLNRSVGTGQGILPMLTNYMAKFIRAEAALTLGTGEDARELLESGVRASVQKVQAFGRSISEVSPEVDPLITPTDTYVSAVMTKYDAADEAGKLEIIIDQAYIANFGNSVESYNNFRRTGYPVLQEVVDDNEVGPFPLRLVYVVDEIGANANIPQDNNATKPVFWDIN